MFGYLSLISWLKDPNQQWKERKSNFIPCSHRGKGDKDPTTPPSVPSGSWSVAKQSWTNHLALSSCKGVCQVENLFPGEVSFLSISGLRISLNMRFFWRNSNSLRSIFSTVSEPNCKAQVSFLSIFISAKPVTQWDGKRIKNWCQQLVPLYHCLLDVVLWVSMWLFWRFVLLLTLIFMQRPTRSFLAVSSVLLYA